MHCFLGPQSPNTFYLVPLDTDIFRNAKKFLPLYFKTNDTLERFLKVPATGEDCDLSLDYQNPPYLESDMPPSLQYPSRMTDGVAKALVGTNGDAIDTATYVLGLSQIQARCLMRRMECSQTVLPDLSQRPDCFADCIRQVHCLPIQYTHT